ncbi:MAG: hypothetical protein BGP12_01665 [Rhodospirillales bacterium 70-18]|nr:MAG: hypothetical protein BGP12_01665 [Rhodospirillales bacterium 70-18]
MDWDDLRSFLAIARHGTQSAAARALGVRQTTMGRRLAGLQERAGALLLQKTPGGYVPTAAGEAILGNVERIESEALAIARSITGRDIRLEGTVRVTTIETLAVEVLLPALPAFQAQHPGIALEIVADQRSLSLTQREADIAIRLARLPQQDLAVRRIGELASAVYAAPDYLDRHGMPDFAAGAAGHTLVLPGVEMQGLPEVAWFTALTAAARPALRSNARYIQRAAAVRGLGLACLSRYLGDGTGLVRVPTPTPGPRREVWLAVHNDIRHTPRIRVVGEFLAATIRAHAGMLAPPE